MLPLFLLLHSTKFIHLSQNIIKSDNKKKNLKSFIWCVILQYNWKFGLKIPIKRRSQLYIELLIMLILILVVV